MDNDMIESKLKAKTTDNRQKTEYHVVVSIKETADRQKLSRRKYMARHIGSEKS